MDHREFVVATLQQTSELARKNFGKVAWRLKGDYSQVLTETDVAIGRLIIERINQEFPDYNIIDEETGAIDRRSDYTFVVDPIDGTSNFAFGVPTYGTMIGLLCKDKPVVGGLALPFFKEIYFAEKDKGATCNGKQVEVTKEIDLTRCLVSYSIDANREHPEETEKETSLAAKIILSVRSLRMSNSVFDTAMVVKGKYGAYMMQHSKIWDNVAQQILVEEAGGVYTDFWGEKIDYRNPLLRLEGNFTFCAAGVRIYEKLQEIIHG